MADQPARTASRRSTGDFAARVDPGTPRTVRVTGPVDITSAAAFADRLDVAGRGGVHPLIVDLTGVEVLTSSGVSVLFAARDRHATHGTELTIVAAADSVCAQVLDLVGLPHTSTPPDRPAD